MRNLKKIAFLIFLLIGLSVQVHAKDLYLEELTILNGEISPVFEKLNNEYTITLPKEEYTVEMEYKESEGCTVSVLDNFDLENNSKVTILLKNEKNTSEYHFHILKEEEEETQSAFSEETKELPTGFMYTYKQYIIPSLCFLLIAITYKCIFYKKKKHK